MELMHAALLCRFPAGADSAEQWSRIHEDWSGDVGRLSGDDINWGYLVADDDPCLLDNQTLKSARLLSKKSPLLFFFTTDEYYCENETEESNFSGWGFRIFDQGEQKAEVLFSYSWPSYGEALKSQLEHALTGFDPALFQLFSLGSARETALVELLDADTLFARLEQDDLLEDIEQEFARILDIETDFLGTE